MNRSNAFYFLFLRRAAQHDGVMIMGDGLFLPTCALTPRLILWVLATAEPVASISACTRRLFVTAGPVAASAFQQSLDQ